MEKEAEILEFWKKHGVFEKTLKKPSPKGEFIFYEGPPTANGRPGIHHLESRAFKDAIPRYRTMRGYHVRRKAGWDTHGLPVELEVEKKLGLKSKKEIEAYGIAKFNAECRKSVGVYLDEWEKFTDRIGFWVDKNDAYFTYQNSYIESLWSILGTVNDQGLLYKDYKVVPWCPRCGTALSSHELAQGYEEVKDLSLYVKFKVKNPEKIGLSGDVYLLAWTTTPWTLPGNVALAVGKQIEYVAWSEKDSLGKTSTNVLSKEAFNRLGIQAVTVNVIINSASLEKVEYEPLYPFTKKAKPAGIEKAYKVYAADFVTTEDGTGIVHTAVMYGADDFNLGTAVGLPKHHLVGEDGRFGKGTDFLEGRLVTETDVAVDILKDLEKRGFFFKKESYAHSYPHCWRCNSKLIYFARDSWYIRMSALRDELIKENQKINWEPAYFKEGRFGEWLREVKDWAISRERYWGTPLPVWQTEDGERAVVASIESLKKYAKKSGNRYFIMRHGQSVRNVNGTVDSEGDPNNHLTEIGRSQVKRSAAKLDKIDRIITSPLLRARQTAEIVAKELGLPASAITTDDRLREIGFGKFNGRPVSEFQAYIHERNEFLEGYPGGESHNDVKRRVMAVLDELEKKHQNERILMVTHESGAWMLLSGAAGHTPEESLTFRGRKEEMVLNGEARELKYAPFPHNEEWELDLHRPFIDEVVLVSPKSGKEMRRVKEVMDVWFDSGGMPFAQDHYPFENKKNIDGGGYPADFICEAIDQTRGWFYTLHAVGNLMGRGRAFKNVICLGHVLDKDGKKMSKSLGNAVDPWQMIDKYGVDTLRLWMYSVNQPGESKNFDEKTVEEVRKTFTLLANVLSFYGLYRDRSIEKNEHPSSKHVLDQWVIARLDEVTEEATRSLDAYKVLEPARAIRAFVDDLSTWYLRRSRERLKDGDADAKQTLYFVLKTLAKLMAPLTPFVADGLYRALRGENDPLSVHLEAWPEGRKVDAEVFEKMKTTRRLVELALAARAGKGVKVRQPLSLLEVSKDDGEFFDGLVKEEVNVKKVLVGAFPKGQVTLDFNITPELKHEGQLRDLTRAVQELRKRSGLTPRDVATLVVSTNPAGEAFIRDIEKELKKVTLIKEVRFEKLDGEPVKINELEFVLSVRQ